MQKNIYILIPFELRATGCWGFLTFWVTASFTKLQLPITMVTFTCHNANLQLSVVLRRTVCTQKLAKMQSWINNIFIVK